MLIKAILTNTVLFYDARGHGALLSDEHLSSTLSQDQPQAFNNGNYGTILFPSALLICNSASLTLALHSMFFNIP